jgi:hypothetical protein
VIEDSDHSAAAVGDPGVAMGYDNGADAPVLGSAVAIAHPPAVG